MTEKDLIFTPLYLIIIYLGAYWHRSNINDQVLKKYYIPALTLKIIGAISLGLIYQFYYSRGDTYNYFNQGSYLYESFFTDPLDTISIIFTKDSSNINLLNHIKSNLIWFNTIAEWIIVCMSAIFGVFSFNTYSIIAIFFSLICFVGSINLYKLFIQIFPSYKKESILAIFFIPSVFFWGSGLMKDSIVLGAIGFMVYGFYNLFCKRNISTRNIIKLLIGSALLFSVKIFIFMCLIPLLILWFFIHSYQTNKSKVVKYLVIPVLLILSPGATFFALNTITKDDKRYSFEKIETTAHTTSVYLTKQVKSGSTYYIGDIKEKNYYNYLKIFPNAILIVLLRPSLLDVNNPVMLLSALENFIILILILKLLITVKIRRIISQITSSPFIMFCIFFTIFFGYGVAITSGNFGTLVRYKVPILPFYIFALLILNKKSSKISVEPTD